MSKKAKQEELATEAVQFENQQDESQVKAIESSELKELSDEELKAEFEKHEKMANEFGKLLQTKGYAIKLDDIKDAKSLLKHLEKNVKWTHSDAPLFIAVYQKLKDAIAAGLNESNELYLDGPALNSLYQLLLKSEGVGYFAVRDYISLLTTVGEGISNAMRKLSNDQAQLRTIHTNLSAIDDETAARQMGIQVEETVKENQA
jgi:hypothetical protein